MMDEISVEPLVQSPEPQEVRCGAVGCGGSLSLPKDSRGVVVELLGGEFADVGKVGEHILVGDGTSQLQVTIGDGAVWVVEGHKVTLDRRGELGSPEV
jgi:hypothetical protein